MDAIMHIHCLYRTPAELMQTNEAFDCQAHYQVNYLMRPYGRNWNAPAHFCNHCNKSTKR